MITFPREDEALQDVPLRFLGYGKNQNERERENLLILNCHLTVHSML